MAPILARSLVVMPSPEITARRRLLLVHAHPDDEAISNGATMARYVDEGAHVTLVTCTLGEEGEILVPELAGLTPGELGRHRMGELAAAMTALGVSDQRWLGGAGRYRDSGMMGLETNDRPGCFWRADVAEAAAHLVGVVREVRPQVLVTYDPSGGYGHPDHIQTHRVAVCALDLAADPSYRPELGAAWRVGKVYWTCVPRSVVEEGLAALRGAGDDTSFEDLERAEDAPFVVPDELVSTRLDGTAHVDAKIAAMRAHATQISVDGPFFALSNNLGQQIWAQEYYRLVQGERGPDVGPDGRESDLFSGLPADRPADLLTGPPSGPA
ncbi:MAG: N-acetyl-1-D-myo-inositol-2-amino-2-deoxy-alpha-D-glucopyranoside deacetylase [Carbonactinosporaceae bacterium]